MPNPWFRFYDEVVDDPKVQLLPDRLFKAWINFLCIANKNTESRGTLPEIKEVAYRLHITTIRAEALLNELVAANLFEWKDGVCRAHNWDGRQFQSDTSAERTRRWRERHRDAESDVVVTSRVTDQKQKQIHNQNQKKEKPAPVEDDRRVPFKDFMFAELRSVGVEPDTTAATWKHYEDFLTRTRNKPPFALEKLQEYFRRFVHSPEGFHRRQGDPIRWFCNNVNPFMRNDDGAYSRNGNSNSRTAAVGAGVSTARPYIPKQ